MQRHKQQLMQTVRKKNGLRITPTALPTNTNTETPVTQTRPFDNSSNVLDLQQYNSRVLSEATQTAYNVRRALNFRSYQKLILKTNSN